MIENSKKENFNQPLIEEINLESTKETSRLKKHLQRQTVRNIFLVLAGIIILFAIFILFGTELLINFSVLMDKIRGGNQENTHSNLEEGYLAPPVLNPMWSATNSAKVSITGYSSQDHTINLYINGSLKGRTEVKDDKSFLFRNVRLEEGENDIKAKSATRDNKQSEYSNNITIHYIQNAPPLDIESPQTGQSFSKDENPIRISGKTHPGNKVTINGIWAIVDGSGKFSSPYTLINGENIIRLESTDEAGNRTTKEITVTYSP